MRLIDADALEDKAKQYSLGYYEADEWAVPLCEINEAPSIDIEPKRGEWMDDDFVGQYRCSECDYYAIDEYDYCPNCGADMRKESER